MFKAKYKYQIIKIQKPIVTTGVPEAMVTNEDESLITFLPWTQELDGVFGDDLKQYWWADVPKFDKGYIKLVKQADEQDW